MLSLQHILAIGIALFLGIIISATRRHYSTTVTLIITYFLFGLWVAGKLIR